MVAFVYDAKVMVAKLLLMTTIMNVDGNEHPFRMGLGIGRSLLRPCKTDYDCVATLGRQWRCFGDTCRQVLNQRRDVQPRVGNCPEGYEYQQGDAKGLQHAIRGPSGLFYNPFRSISDCARICDGITACKAIEWSPSELKCVFINTTDSSGPKYLDYEFCRKG